MSLIAPLSGTPAEIWDELRIELDALQGVKPLPIKGGWGYTQDEACVIESQVPIDSFEGIDIEAEFVKRRLMEELIVQRFPGMGFRGIEWDKTQQSLCVKDDRRFDHVVYEVRAIPQADWLKLKKAYEGPEGVGSPGFDAHAHQARYDACVVRFQAEFWFDITSFFGRH